MRAQIMAKCSPVDHTRNIHIGAHIWPLVDDGYSHAQQEGKHSMTADVHGGRILDTAKGILIGIRRCRSEAAFHELLNAAQRHRMPVFAMAGALVHLANGGQKSAQMSIDAEFAARSEWGQLFADSALTV
jgi:ANTAR domain